MAPLGESGVIERVDLSVLARPGTHTRGCGSRTPTTVRFHGMIAMNRPHVKSGISAGLLRALAWAALLVTMTPSHADEFKLGERTLRVPGGFTIERMAGPPVVDR